MSALPKTLRARMQEKNLSANALEKLAGLKPSVVQNILQGKSKNPTIHTLRAISQVLECQLEELADSQSAVTRSKQQQQSVEWNSALYHEAMQIANELFTARNVKITKEQALNYIDEIYTYSITGKQQHIDRLFAEWLLKKQFP